MNLESMSALATVGFGEVWEFYARRGPRPFWLTPQVNSLGRGIGYIFLIEAASHAPVIATTSTSFLPYLVIVIIISIIVVIITIVIIYSGWPGPQRHG